MKPVVFALAALALVPALAFAQSTDQIVIQQGPGAYARGEAAFVFGSVGTQDDGLRIAIQVVNPAGDMCNVQQTAPLDDGSFISEPVRLSGAVCGQAGAYQIRIFYGDGTETASFDVSAGQAAPGLEPAALVDKKIADLRAAGIDVSQQRRAGSLHDQYVDLWDRYNAPDAMLGVSVQARPAVQAALDASARLLESGDIEYDRSKQIDRAVYSAIFNYETGQRAEGIGLLSEAFGMLRESGATQSGARVAFDDLEETLTNLMVKNDTILSGQVKESLAFVLARGTAPLVAGQLADTVDMLTKARYLDVVSRNDSALYRLVSSEWDRLRLTMVERTSLGSLLESKPGVDRLHEAAILLRQLDGVERFLPDEGQDGEIEALIRPSWDALDGRLSGAGSVADILGMREEIERMKDVIDISSRISRTVQIASSTGLDPGYASGWSAMLERVSRASSLAQIEGIISEFEQSITDLRENRSPLAHLRLEYERLRQQAQLRDDTASLVDIERALRIIKSAENTGHGTSQVDSIEVLLAWASQRAPVIQASLSTTSSAEATRERAADVLQRIQSLDNLVELSIVKSRFLPGFVDFTRSVEDGIKEARQKVIDGDLASADAQIRELFSEWRTVTAAYEKEPGMSHSLDDLKRRDYGERLDEYEEAADNFDNPGFDEHQQGYEDMDSRARSMLEYGNFADAELEINRIGDYLAENLALKHPGIFFEIEYENDAWTLSGAVDKDYNEREKITVIIYDENRDEQGVLEMFDTRQGTFFTRWEEPVDPGLYVVMLKYRNTEASNIVHVEEDIVHEPDSGELDVQRLSREFTELERFMREYGGDRASNPRIAEAGEKVREGLAERDLAGVSSGMQDLQMLVERYLPVRHRDAVIDASYESGELEMSGAVRKSVAFSEDMFVDVRDQRGDLVYSTPLKDDAAGMFSASVVRSLDPGMYVVLLEYHDITVTDFFAVR